MVILGQITQWVDNIPAIVALMSEYESFNFTNMNLTIRVLFSHFLRFSTDKYKHPEFFCWPGAWMAGERASDNIQNLFLKHQSLFSNKETDEGIFPRQLPGRDPEGIMQTFNTFYGTNLLYDLTRQWIYEDGPFVYDLSWLSTAHTKDQLETAAKTAFENLFGVNPDKFQF